MLQSKTEQEEMFTAITELERRLTTTLGWDLFLTKNIREKLCFWALRTQSEHQGTR